VQRLGWTFIIPYGLFYRHWGHWGQHQCKQSKARYKESQV